MSGKITSLVIQKKNKDRVNVFIDDEFAFGLSLSEAFHLKKGQFLTDRDIEELKASDEIETAREKALHFLSFRSRSIDEVRKNLTQKGFSELTVETVLYRLEEVGLLDDDAFARAWVRDRDQFEPRGTIGLRYELRQKGVDDEILDPILDEYDEVDAAYRSARKQLRKYENADYTTFKGKLGGYLKRRGFSYHVITDVLVELWDEISQNS